MLSDEILAERILHGDTAAFEELVNRYKNSIFHIVYRMVGQYQEAEDITQEVFILVYDKLYQFDRTKRFRPWIHRIAVNTAISNLRKKKKVVQLSFDESFGQTYQDYPSVMEGDPEAIFERKEIMEDIRASIMELPESYRTVLVLRYQMDMKNAEIAETLGVSKENIEVRIHRARKALRRVLLKRWEERGVQRELSTL
ncbi:MAG: RNA polymerase sigma factor [Syntrophomonadaceae bacterium]|nr:sigma-70 family RNA polymerase sigma factor [Bacillota bacterium]NLM88527.1 sigma-70 family RNA polymerase sigma factor [Syntrophomonadaceae bacterium]HAA09043.1 RNA polymerase subunit sigma-24 [Syntrophomonas sp.]HQA49794.1 sigma-70 family RNA polymerase sigma factor [Syntrophomonadaceae bacterium]HQD90920.1 sigma-70 family RNA polymerase sigma factor [Syntrophomonadaceae bacterium]